MASYGFATEGTTVVTDFAAQVKDRVFLITGPSTGGIGAETAISLAHGSPSQILLLGRSLSKIQPVIDAIQSLSPSTLVKFFSVSLDSLTSVRIAAAQIVADKDITHIDVVINNAAVMACPYSVTEDGFETQFATNHLSHFLLTNLLMPKILASEKPRIVNVSSIGHIRTGVNFAGLGFDGGKTYDLWNAYGQSKTANILFSVALNQKMRKGDSWALHPGSIESGLQKHITEETRQKAIAEYKAKGFEMAERKTLQQGCSTTLRAALDPDLKPGEKVVDKDGKGGMSWYLDDCQVETNPKKVAAYALDEKDALKLWEMSEEMVGERFDF